MYVPFKLSIKSKQLLSVQQEPLQWRITHFSFIGILIEVSSHHHKKRHFYLHVLRNVMSHKFIILLLFYITKVSLDQE